MYIDTYLFLLTGNGNINIYDAQVWEIDASTQHRSVFPSDPPAQNEE